MSELLEETPQLVRPILRAQMMFAGRLFLLLPLQGQHPQTLIIVTVKQMYKTVRQTATREVQLDVAGWIFGEGMHRGCPQSLRRRPVPKRPSSRPLALPREVEPLV